MSEQLKISNGQSSTVILETLACHKSLTMYQRLFAETVFHKHVVQNWNLGILPRKKCKVASFKVSETPSTKFKRFSFSL